MKSALLPVAVVLLSGSSLAGEAPTLAIGPRGLALGRLPPVLGDATVARHLDTGLTTVFRLSVEGRGRPGVQGGAQVSVRYDLWDEVYRAERRDATGEVAAATLPSREALRQWWRALVLVVSPALEPATARPAEARVTLQVLPFSQAEQRDAQEWLLRSLRGSDPPPPPDNPSDVRLAPRSPIGDFYGAMLASSIGRRSLITYSWTVPIGDER